MNHCVDEYHFIVVHWTNMLLLNVGVGHIWTELGWEGLWTYQSVHLAGKSLGPRYPHCRVVSQMELFLNSCLLEKGSLNDVSTGKARKETMMTLSLPYSVPPQHGRRSISENCLCLLIQHRPCIWWQASQGGQLLWISYLHFPFWCPKLHPDLWIVYSFR